MKFCSENRFLRASQKEISQKDQFLASLADKFRSETRESRKQKFLARLARIITNFNSGVVRESCEKFQSNTNFSLSIMTLLVYETHKLRDSQIARPASLTIYRIFLFLRDSLSTLVVIRIFSCINFIHRTSLVYPFKRADLQHVRLRNLVQLARQTNLRILSSSSTSYMRP